MSKNFKNRKFGLPPGSLVYTGDYINTESEFQLYKYDDERCEVFSEKDVDVVLSHIDKSKKCWLIINGISEVEHTRKIGDFFNLNALVLEDILDTAQRPKCETYENYLFFTLKYFNPKERRSIKKQYEQVSIILSKNLVILFQEKETEWLNNIRERLVQQDNFLRKRPTDYLFYRIIDTIVDHYYMVIEDLGNQFEELELKINKRAEDEDLKSLQHLKRILIYIRKSVYPLREAIAVAVKDDNCLDKSVHHYMSDVYDHTIHIIETIETYRDLTSGLMDLYMTAISNRMNEIMKVLTVIATIFIPITFISSVYGMNFKFMPELDYKWAYPACLAAMGVITLIMILYFKRKKWL